MTRFSGRPAAVKSLLAEGEHTHVDYKEVLPAVGKFAEALCAAANSVACHEGRSEFVFLVGVEEVTATSGLVSGRVTGLFDRGTQSFRDLESEKKHVVDAGRLVEPTPDIEIDECDTGKAKPFLVVRVRPTDAPHRVGDRYLARGVSHTVPLEQHQIRRLFAESRGQAFIDDVAGDNHLSRALMSLRVEVGDLELWLSGIESAVEEETLQRRRAASALDARLDELRDHLAGAEELADLTGELSSVPADVGGLYSHVTEAARDLESVRQFLRAPTFETAIDRVVESRQLNWALLCSWHRQGLLPTVVWDASKSLFEAFFFDDPLTADRRAVVGEHDGWLDRSTGPVESGSWDLVLHRACLAAVGASMAGRSGRAWMEAEASGSFFGEHSWWVALVGRETVRPPSANRDWDDETAVLLVDSERFRTRAVALGAELFDLPETVSVFRLSDCRVEVRHSQDVSGLVLRPNPTDTTFPDTQLFFRDLRRQLRRSSAGLTVVRARPGSGGQLARLAGERVQ